MNSRPRERYRLPSTTALLLAVMMTTAVMTAVAPRVVRAAEGVDAGDTTEQGRTVASWPTYLHDAARSGHTPDAVRPPLVLAWRHELDHPPNPAWPPPAKQNVWAKEFDLQPRVVFDRAAHVVSDGERVYYGSSADDQVRCLDLASGKLLWTAFAEGPVRLAPLVHEDRVYFGADDGAVYCVAAADGHQLWKTRIAPSDRRIAGNGRLISAWPVRAGLILKDGRIRAACGLFPTQGTYQVMLDAASGKELARGRLDISPQGYLELRGEQIVVNNGRAAKKSIVKLPVAHSTFDEENSKHPLAELARITTGDVEYVGYDGHVVARSIVSKAVGAKPDGEKKELWRADVDGRAYGLAAAGGRLLVSTDRGMVYCFAPKKLVPEPEAKSSGPNLTPLDFVAVAGDVVDPVVAQVDAILRTSGVTKGYALVIGIGDGRLVQELARRTQLQVIGLDPDARKVKQVRRRLVDAKLYGRAVVHHGSGETLPYGDCLLNLVVVANRVVGLGSHIASLRVKKHVILPSEIIRVLRPEEGVAIVRDRREQVAKWLATDPKENNKFWKLLPEASAPIAATGRRPAISGSGSWTHMYANAANTICSEDQAEGELTLQWFGQPGPRNMVDRHHRAVAPLSVGGRLFIPGDNRLFAVDAYNGTPLWDATLEGSRRIGANKDCGNMVATRESLYIVFGETCRVFNAKTGEVASDISLPKPEGDDERRAWGYLAVAGDQLVGSATKPGASRSELGRKSIYGVYLDRRPVVTSDWLFSLARDTHKPLWRYDSNLGVILNPTITIGDEHIYFVESDSGESLNEPTGRLSVPRLVGSGARLVALDRKTGTIAWQHPVEFTNLEHNIYLSFSDGRLFIVGSRNQDTGEVDDKGRKMANVWYDTYAYDAATGELLWKQQQDNLRRAGGFHGEQDKRPAIVGETIYIEPYAYNIKDGQRRKEWRLTRKIWCGNISASANSLFFRNSHTARCDLKTGEIHSVCRVNRPGCWVNVISAGGLVLMPETSSGCTCDYPVQTSMAFMPASVRQTAGKRVLATGDAARENE